MAFQGDNMFGSESDLASRRRVSSGLAHITLLVIMIGSVAGVRLAGVETIVASPARTSLAPGATLQFTASKNGVPTSVKWRATGGTITQGGLFTAGQTAGTYRVTATGQRNRSQGTAEVVITSGLTLTQLIVNPASQTVQQGSNQAFSATGVWSGPSSSPANVSWSATGGTVTSAGIYTAGQTAGTYQVVASQSGSTGCEAVRQST